MKSSCLELATRWKHLFDSKVKETVAGQKLAVACSGGADSVALLHWAVGTFGADQLLVLHFNHRTRADENDQDALFVQELASSLGVMGTVVGLADQDLSNANESDLRRARNAFFKKSLNEANISILLQGHHQDDQLESFLIRISRGGNLSSLLTPKKKVALSSYMIVRPLLGLSRQEMQSTLGELQINWREDPSNQSEKYYRNRVRNRLIPLWNKLCPTVLKPSLQRTMSLLSEDLEAIEQWTEKSWSLCLDCSGNLVRNELNAFARAIQRRCIEKFFHSKGMGDFISVTIIDKILDRLASGDNVQIQISDQLLFVLDQNHGFFEEQNLVSAIDFQCSLVLDSEILLEKGKLHASIVDITDELQEFILGGNVDQNTHAYLAVPSECSQLLVRSWQFGDRYYPLGAPGKKKLQDWFIDYKIDASVRAVLPVICADEILWVPGFAPAENYRLKASDHKALRLTYTSY